MTRQSHSEAKLRDRLEELKAFKKKHGHCDLWDYRHSHPELWKWSSSQRVNQQRGLLSLKRRRLLDKIGFEWSLQEFRWNKRFEQLKAFKQRYGHCRVPQNWKEDPQFSRWVSVCRHRPNRLSEQRKQKLASLGFEWKRDTSVTFQRWLEKLKAFKRKFGHCRITELAHEYRSLANWCGIIRFKERCGKGIPAERKRLLNEIGFEWFPLESEWRRRYEELRVFRKKIGHCWIRPSDPSRGKLIRWMTYQRLRKSKGKLSPKKIRLLDQLGFEWEAKRNPMVGFQRHLEALKTFKKRFGHCLVTRAWPEYHSLASWCRIFRSQVLHGRQLSIEQKRLLDEIGFVWIPSEVRWQRRYEELRAHWKKFGHFRIKPDNPDQIKLRRWVLIQRMQRRKRQLSSEQIRLLNKLGFEWNPQSATAAFQKRLEELRAFQKKFGHCRVMSSRAEYRSLALWCARIRLQQRRGPQLSEEQKRLLNEIGFKWSPAKTGWQWRYEELRDFRERFGHCRIGCDDPNRAVLRRWALKQRFSKRKGRLSLKKVRLLDKLGFEWESSKVSLAC